MRPWSDTAKSTTSVVEPPRIACWLRFSARSRPQVVSVESIASAASTTAAMATPSSRLMEGERCSRWFEREHDRVLGRVVAGVRLSGNGLDAHLDGRVLAEREVGEVGEGH